VVLDGRPLGDTPKIGISVQPGKHTVVFIGESGRKTATAPCMGGEKKTVAIQFK
jgi:serine/threonine-protein kinase